MTTEQLWWTLRHYWHNPGTLHTMAKNHIDGLALWRIYGWPFSYTGWRLFKMDMKTVWVYFYSWLLWLQPLRCNGNYGGWRTRFCDFLEDRARSYTDDK